MIKGKHLNDVKAISPIKRKRRISKKVCLKGEVYAFGGENYNEILPKCIISVKKYSPVTDI